MNLATVSARNLRRHPLRTTLTILGVAVAMVTFVLLRTLLSAWSVGAKYAAQDRIATRNKVSFVMWIPQRYVQDVRAVDGVVAATWMTWFGAHVPGAEDELFANWACDPQSLLEVYDDLVLPPAEKQAFFENRQGAIVGRSLARKFGWKVGDRVILQGAVVPGKWELRVEGIYTASRKSVGESSLFFHWSYMNQTLPRAVQDKAGYILSRVKSADVTSRVVKQIDRVFDSADVQTLSMSERALNTSFLGLLSTLLQVVDGVSLIVLTIMTLILGNTIAMSVRERTREYGTMRALGFQPRHILWSVGVEALAVAALGGLLGIGSSALLINQSIGPLVEQTFTAWFPYFRLEWSDAIWALIAVAAGAAVSAALPATQASRLVVTDALRKVT